MKTQKKHERRFAYNGTFLVSVKAATLILISARVSAISSAQKKENQVLSIGKEL